jgi:hypothetical protein
METLVKFTHLTYLFQAMRTFQGLETLKCKCLSNVCYNKIVLYVVRSIFFAKSLGKTT